MTGSLAHSTFYILSIVSTQSGTEYLELMVGVGVGESGQLQEVMGGP